MIKFTKQDNGLKEYSKRITYIDNDSRSKNYFKLYDFPDRLYVGKNAFRLSGNSEFLVKNSKIYIDIYDANGGVIYHEILDVANKDRMRTVVVYIYPDTPPGDATVYVAGRLGVDPRDNSPIYYTDDPSSNDYYNVPNMMWIGKPIVITNKQNNSEIFFASDPIISYSERLATYRTVKSGSGSSRLTEVYSTASRSELSIKSVIQPYQFSADTSKFADSYVDSSKKFQPIPSITNNAGESSKITRLPEYNGLSVISSDFPFFVDTMAGGMIYVRDINVNRFKPSDAVDTSSFDNIPDYSASIVKVVNSKTVQVDTPFYHKVTYRTNRGETKDIVFTQFVDILNCTASYYNDDVTLNESSGVESFVTLDFRGIEPSAGTVDSIRVSYKDVGAFGEFVDIGKFPATSQNLLTDESTLRLTTERGLIEYEIGKPRTQTDIDTYWTSSAVGMNGPTTMTLNNNNIVGGMAIIHSGSQAENQYVVTTVRNAYSVLSSENTEYKLVFESYNASGSSWSRPSIDVYISGSPIISDQIRSTERSSPIKSPALGTYVGTIDSKEAARKSNEIFFITKERKYIKPVFVVRSGIWEIGQIELRTRKEVGFSPNQVKLNIPISEFKRSAELIIGVEYYNNEGIKSNTDTKLYGVYFSGSTPITYDNLPDKLNIQNAGSGRLFTSTGNPSESYAAPSLLYNSSSMNYEQTQRVDQLQLANRAELVMFVTDSMSDSFHAYRGVAQNYIHQATFSFGSGVSIVDTFVPFTRMDTGERYDYTHEYAAMAFTAESVIFGISGSTSNPTQSSSVTHVWSSTIQGRVYISDYGIGSATLFDAYIVSGGMRTYGAFGTVPAGQWNLDHVYTVGAYSDTNGIRIRHFMAPISSSNWFGFVTTKSNVIKYERIIFA